MAFLSSFGKLLFIVENADLLQVSAMDGKNGIHDKTEALQHAEKLPVPEGLAGGGEACFPGGLLKQRIGRMSLQQAGLLVVAVAVDLPRRQIPAVDFRPRIP